MSAIFNGDPEAKLIELGFELPPASKPVGLYKPILLVGHLAYVSGHGPLLPDGRLMRGRVGDEVNLDGGRAAARQVGLAILATLKSRLGKLDRVRRVIKLFGIVYATADFVEHPQIINGCSELFAKIFGDENGIGTRSAIGAVSLPGGISVEIEGVFEIRD